MSVSPGPLFGSPATTVVNPITVQAPHKANSKTSNQSRVIGIKYSKREGRALAYAARGFSQGSKLCSLCAHADYGMGMRLVLITYIGDANDIMARYAFLVETSIQAPRRWLKHPPRGCGDGQAVRHRSREVCIWYGRALGIRCWRSIWFCARGYWRGCYRSRYQHDRNDVQVGVVLALDRSRIRRTCETRFTANSNFGE
jgi:hypothetical protein